MSKQLFSSDSNTVSSKTSSTDSYAGIFESFHESTIKIGQSFTPVAQKKLVQHEHLYYEGEKQKHIYQIITGVIGIYKMLSDGRRHITKFYYPGDLIGLGEQGAFLSQAEALCDTKVRCIPIKTIDSLMVNEPGFGRAILSLVTSDLMEAREQLLTLGRKSALERVASFFNEIHKKSQTPSNSKENDRLHLPMSRAEIADYLGLTIETVSRSITQLKVAKVINSESRTSFIVLNAERLQEFSDNSCAAIKAAKPKTLKAA